jgi:hypothetical protein
MLKPIHPAPCAPALRACRLLQEKLLDWLCDPAVGPADVTQGNLAPPRIPTQVEANWFWSFLQREMGSRPLLERVQVLAGMTVGEKAVLRTWIQTVSAIASQFLPNPPAWPQIRPAISDVAWNALKELTGAFYEKGLRGTNGMPYLPDGTPTAGGGVTYAQFVQEFRDAHRLNPSPNARDVCVLCGGPLGPTPEVDHWVAKSAFPLLSVCADNLLPICGDCNSTTNKGEKLTCSHGAGSAFEDWFHPYLRPANGAIRLDYKLDTQSIVVAAHNPTDSIRVANLDKLLNLATRWTKEFKAEYAAQQECLRRRIKSGLLACTQPGIEHHVQGERVALVPSEPHHEVHQAVLGAMLDQSRLASWQIELGLA